MLASYIDSKILFEPLKINRKIFLIGLLKSDSVRSHLRINVPVKVARCFFSETISERN